MNTETVVTRFPPSPTGYLHIGGARTALFNWLFARHYGGRFVLRIEDTDRERSTPEATQAILASMEWLGLDWDEGPYFQSERLDIHNTYIERLLSEGRAYYCHCSPQVLEAKRAQALASGAKPKYDGTCRDRNLGPAPGCVVRLKSPLTGSTQFTDLVKGPIRIQNEELDDLILKRSDGSPTYHLAVVVDDITMGINYVIRGDDHVNNTPRQVLIYRALDEPLPRYAHVPMILGPDKTRLSKRHGAMSVLAYREMGYLPQALLNALARLGWSHGDQEKFTREELISYFDLSSVGKAAGVFNPDKLLDLNAWYIRESVDDTLAVALRPFLARLGFEAPDERRLRLAAASLKKRSKTLVEMAEGAVFYFADELVFEPAAAAKFLTAADLPLLVDLRQWAAQLDDLSQAGLEAAFTRYMETSGVKLKRLAQPLRVALTGKTASPGLFEVMEVLGREAVLRRLDRAIAHIHGNPA